MVDWRNPNVIAYNFFLYEQISVIVLGFYGTHVLNTWYVEWELIQRKRAFRLVHVPFLLARYITLSALLFFVVSGHVKERIACDPAYRLFAVPSAGSRSLASHTTPLVQSIQNRDLLDAEVPHPALHPRVRRPHPSIPRSVPYVPRLLCSHRALLMSCGIWTVRARWDTSMNSCTVITWDATFLAVFYLYTFVFDVLILLATLCAVRRVHEEQMSSRPWGVGGVLCVQGIGYVAATGAANLPVAVLAFLDLNAGMDVLLSQPAMTVGVIASSLAFLGLEDAGAKAKSAPTRALSAAPGDSGYSSSDGRGLVTTHIPIHLS
ncbi:hypothetical protein LXA43DRAFT_887850 [Ganoderma leucocontextum]|nr:hypothetical protein LXA43DRAFT_887850 [Ganoderma leucocontextum]